MTIIVSPSEQVDFARNKQLLNRYRYIEHEMVRILAGWLPGTAQLDFKLAIGRYLWEDAQHVQHLYQRLREVQTPAFRDPADTALLRLMQEAIHAPNERDLLAGLFRVIKPALAKAYKWHLKQTFANPDAPTLYALKHILLDEQEQAEWAERALAEHPAGEWEAYLQGLLSAAGGVTGLDERGIAPEAPASRTPFEIAREAKRDPRFTIQTPDNLPPSAYLAEPDERLAEFENYSQEMLAAETVAVVMYLSPNMPWEFMYNSARHCYDETRHCILGLEWMERHGIDYTKVPQNTKIYTWRTQYDPATQYCLLTMGNEKHVFPHRRKRLAAYQESNDTLSAQFLSYDISDERQHVAYGRKWIPQLMASHGIEMSTDQFIEQTVKRWEEEYRSGKLPIHSQA